MLQMRKWVCVCCCCLQCNNFLSFKLFVQICICGHLYLCQYSVVVLTTCFLNVETIVITNLYMLLIRIMCTVDVQSFLVKKCRPVVHFLNYHFEIAENRVYHIAALTATLLPV